MVVGDAIRGKGPVESVAGDPPPVTIPMAVAKKLLDHGESILAAIDCHDLDRSTSREESQRSEADAAALRAMLDHLRHDDDVRRLRCR